jgi:mercuric ion transport protein
MSAPDSIPAAPIQRSAATGGRILGSLGAASGLGAVLTKSCCILPIALGGLGLGTGASALVEALEPFQMPLLIASGVAVAGGWLAFLYYQMLARGGDVSEVRECAPCAVQSRPSRTAIILIVGTALFVAAAAWNAIQPVLVDLVR